MHADIIGLQENNLTHKAKFTLGSLTVSEPSEKKPNLVDRTCELLK